ncbi:hypothetical protein M407DRAFT_178685 [Tulasnella calospora MUT 4182]|uniref:Uncharacterized protein n=1 Tax=Tulasnella calospora MUT 4182 TaxID=1051891 RepID=A0A0C3L4C8_9AGAM|nr:hypothetical protein M407DRAFT_178685 [Tulasnella calospora MUT 4182]
MQPEETLLGVGHIHFGYVRYALLPFWPIFVCIAHTFLLIWVPVICELLFFYCVYCNRSPSSPIDAIIPLSSFILRMFSIFGRGFGLAASLMLFAIGRYVIGYPLYIF